MCVTIWANDVDTIETLFDHYKRTAKTYAGEACDDGIASDADWLSAAVIAAAWRLADGDYAPLSAAQLRASIDAVDVEDVAAELAEQNADDLADRIEVLDGIVLTDPVVVDGVTAAWDGDGAASATVHPKTVGDILRTSPWRNMESESWTIDDYDDLRWTGIHHDGANTCTYRIQHGKKTVKLGPVIRKAMGVD